MKTLSRLIALAALIFLLLPCVIQATEDATILNDIQISFKLDPRLTTKSVHGRHLDFAANLYRHQWSEHDRS